MASMVALNAEAPEFYPNNKLQKPQSFCYTFSTPLYRPHPYFYHYPTASKHPFFSTSFSFHYHPPPNHLPTFPRFESETKPPTHFQDGFENHELELQNEMVVEPFIEVDDSNHVFHEVISGGEMEHRRSHGVRSGGRLEWRRKEARKDDEHIEQTEKKVDDERLMRKNRHHHRYAKHVRHHYHKKNSGGRFPLVPVRKDGEETTVMIKNIPSKYTRDMLLDFLDEFCMRENTKDQANGEESTFAFNAVYLPIDFRTELNKGYAFVNFTKHEAAWKFQLTASGKNWKHFNSCKICDVVAARLQGKEKLENHFGSMVFPCSSEEVLPLFFSPPRDGVTKGNQRTLGKLLPYY